VNACSLVGKSGALAASGYLAPDTTCPGLATRSAHRPEEELIAPTIAPGKISYIQIPALDVDRSAAFYETVFRWNIRRWGDGEVAFDDTVGEVSGTWITGRPPCRSPGCWSM
jgi:hypothetical protein